MAINKKLIHFKTKANFNTQLEAGNILDTSIVYIQDAKEIYTHGTYYATTLTAAQVEEIIANSTTIQDMIDTAIANLVDGAPETLDTLDEIAAALKDNADIVTVLENSIATKVDKTDAVTGVKGSAESAYRTGNIEITKANIGLANVDNTADANKSVNYATSAGSATTSTKATQDASGNVITSTYATKTEIANKQDVCLKFSNLSASTWVADTTYSDFGYRCDLACSGVTADMYAEVVFEVTQAASGSYAPVCETGSGIVSIWSSVQDTITVPVIIITK